MAILGAINPTLTAGWNGDDGWSLKDYVARGGYEALKKILVAMKPEEDGFVDEFMEKYNY